MPLSLFFLVPAVIDVKTFCFCDAACVSLSFFSVLGHDAALGLFLDC
jgi:hypothetical protein